MINISISSDFSSHVPLSTSKMNTERKERKGVYQPSNELLPLPSTLVEVPRHPKRSVFRRFLVHASIALTLFLFFYNARIIGFRGSKKVWQYYEKEDSYDSYTERIEESYL